jgi:hypothetical protein
LPTAQKKLKQLEQNGSNIQKIKKKEEHQTRRLNKPNNIYSNSDQILSNKKHILIGNDARNKNLASNLFDFH